MHTKPDALQRFLLEDAHVRGEIAYLKQSYQTIMQQRDYPPTIKRLLGECVVASALLADALKFKGSLSIQFQSDDRLSLILAQCTDQLQLRGLAKYETDLNEPDYLDAFKKGKMVLTLQSEQHTQNYQSQLPIDSPSIADNIMHYFAQSEQIATFVWLALDETQAGGFLLQRLPTSKPHLEDREAFWEYALQIGQTLSAPELFSLSNETLLHRLYHETKVRLFDPKPIQFQCRCTPEKMKQVLRTLGQAECQQHLSTHKTIEVLCDFCHEAYYFDAIDIAMVFAS